MRIFAANINPKFIIMKTNSLLGLAVLLTTSGFVNAAEPLNLTFTRTGSDAASVTVNADASGVNASLISVSHPLKEIGTSTLCPNANGNSSPTIIMQFSITGLPADWSFNLVGLDIRALNSSGNNQQSNDNVKRQFNISVTSGSNTLVTYTDLDPAAGIEGVRKVWESTTAAPVPSSDPMEITLTITKGTTNGGCFFGLEGITLSTTDSPVDPDPKPQLSRFNTIKWKNNTSSYMTEQADGSLAIGPYAISNKVFWEFIPTDNDNCYYIRSTASGKYIGSCNMTPSSSSRVTMSDTPVEYYVHLSASTEGDNKGCFWLSSTDCDNYADESKSARCLNKDGASNYVITWQSGVNNKGSYWSLTETENLYEVRPFTPQPTIGNPSATYYIIDASGRAYNHSGLWQAFSPTAPDAKWYFVGTSNADGGYQIVNAANNVPLNSGAYYTVSDNQGSAPYRFTGHDNTVLALAGQDAFTFVAARSNFALNNQIYQIPCGPVGDTWVASLTIGDGFRYPMAGVSNNELTTPTVTSKPSKYSILSRDAATVNPGAETHLTITLNKIPADNYRMILCFDWNRDGVFESCSEVTMAKDMTSTVNVPSDAVPGRTRMRLRLTSNGITDPDGEVNGQILDLLLNVALPSTDEVAPDVKPNDPARGMAEWDNGIATATAKGNSLFLFWSEGHRIIGVENTLDAPALPMPRTLVATFSANTSELSGIDERLLNTPDSNATINFSDGIITVEGACARTIILFSTDGRVVCSSSTSSLKTSNVCSGLYIAKAITDNGVVSAKLLINPQQ